MDKFVYSATGRVNKIVIADDEADIPALLTTLELTEVPSSVLAHDVLDVGLVYNPNIFDATDPSTYNPADPSFQGLIPPPDDTDPPTTGE